MSQHPMAKCYEEIVKDLALLSLFSPKEYSSIQELPCLGVLWFRLISEGYFACMASPDNWRKIGIEFLTLTSPKRSQEATNSVILIINGAGKGDLGMVMVFCHPDQAQMEACDALSALCKATHQTWAWWWWDNTLTLPTFLEGHPIYFIWMWAVSWGCFLCLISTRQAASVPANSFLQDRVVVTSWRGEETLKIPHLPRDFVGGFGGGTLPFSSNFSVSPHIGPHSQSRRRCPDGGRVRISFSQYSDRGRVRLYLLPQASTGCQSSQSLTGIWAHPGRCENWLKSMNRSEPNRPEGMQGGRHRWLIKHMPCSRRYLPWQVQMEAVKLLPLCLCGGAFLLYKQSSDHCCSTGWEHPHCIQAPCHCI